MNRLFYEVNCFTQSMNSVNHLTPLVNRFISFKENYFADFIIESFHMYV
jgi:hypothetical protein